jgi:hypothetical protein
LASFHRFEIKKVKFETKIVKKTSVMKNFSETKSQKQSQKMTERKKKRNN